MNEEEQAKILKEAMSIVNRWKQRIWVKKTTPEQRKVWSRKGALVMHRNRGHKIKDETLHDDKL